MHREYTHRSGLRRGFTLIELLAVIAILGILIGLIAAAVQGAMKKADETATRAMYGQWTTALMSYKSTYSYFPDLGTGYSGSDDTYYTLDQGDTGQNFVRALSAKNMDGTELSDEHRTRYNKRGKEFTSFPSGYFLDNDPAKLKLADRFGNTKIRIILDTDANSALVLKELPKDTRQLGLQNGNRVNAKIFICTLAIDGPEYLDIYTKQ
jgi:prepilin-type N-terminal cleavage/methylation domain-containing protein